MSRFIRWSLVLLFVLSTGLAHAAELGQFDFWLPNNSWAFWADLTGFNSKGQEVAPDLNGRGLSATGHQDRVLLTIYLDPVNDGLTAAQYRDSFLTGIQGDENLMKIGHLENVNSYESGNIALSKYDLVGAGQTAGFRQFNAIAYWVKDSTALFVHLSSVDPQADVESVYDHVLTSLKVIDNYQPTSMDFFFFASWSYMGDQFARAADYYQRALDLEKQKRELSQDFWRVMVDNLGMSYIFIDNRENAKATYDYGIAEDPEYPLFHYNMACYYAESDQLDSTIAELSKAYEFKANMIPGEEFPDPRKDDSFKRYWNNKTFEDFMSRVTK